MKLRNNVMIHQNRTDVTYEVPTTKRFTSFNAINEDLRLTWGRKAEGKGNYKKGEISSSVYFHPTLQSFRSTESV